MMEVSLWIQTAIPVIALERVEVLKEGAAAVYGSDAVAGVVNYILRRDFTGLEFNLSQQKTDLGDSTDDRVGVIWGKESGDTNIVVAYSQLDRSPIGGENLTDYSQLAISSLGNSFLSLAANNTVASGPYAGTYGTF